VSWRSWFAVEEVAPRTWLIGEPGHVNCFLAEGADRAVLVDSGLGLADIGTAVRDLTDRPVLVVNTHAHSDHRGGNQFFAEVAAHPAAAAELARDVPADQLSRYLAVARQQILAYERMRADDRRFFHLFTDVTSPRPLPSDADAWRVPAGPAPRPLADRERIELGGRALTVLHTPGHSPDSLCLLDEAHGLLFAGDTLITGDFWAHTPDTDIDTFAATLRMLADEIGADVSDIFPAHTLRYRVGPDFLRRAADGFADLVSGSSLGVPGTDLLGRPALRHEFGDFAVLRPLGAGAAVPGGSAAPRPEGPVSGGEPFYAEDDGRVSFLTSLAAIDVDLATAFVRYEDALMDGDLAVMRQTFWDHDDVVRVDPVRPVVGAEALARFRAGSSGPGPRRLRDLYVVPSPGATVVTISINERVSDGSFGAQTQVWARTVDGWRIVAAHVAPVAEIQ